MRKDEQCEVRISRKIISGYVTFVVSTRVTTFLIENSICLSSRSPYMQVFSTKLHLTYKCNPVIPLFMIKQHSTKLYWT